LQSAFARVDYKPTFTFASLQTLIHAFAICKHKIIMKDSHKLFITYVRTKQFWQNRLRNADSMKPVYISMNEIKERFLINSTEIQLLVEANLIEVIQKETTNGHKASYYKAIQAGGINPSLIKPKVKKLDQLTSHMRNILKLVSLTENAASTPYFDTFLYLKKTHIDLFFTIDDFSGRVHTPISSFHRTHRPNILINGQTIESLDVVTMQPLLLGKILKTQIGENEYSNWINSGEDIYLIIQDKAKLNTRDEAKKRFFEILFSKPNEQLSDMFGNSNWIEWINAFKGQPCKYNPHSLEKNHSNLAWLLQTTEVKIMRKVWQAYKDNNILFLSVHDEVIFQKKDLVIAESLFIQIMDKEFEYYKLSSKVKPIITVIEKATLCNTKKQTDIAYSEQLPLIEFSETIKKEQLESWEQDITELENYFKGIALPTQPIKLTKYSTITNCPLFIESHFATVKANNGKRTFLPYLYRLQELKQVLTTNLN
jgi:hypothetical protein